MKVRSPLLLSLLLTSILAGCSEPPPPPPPPVQGRVVELGPAAAGEAGGTEGFARAPLDASQIEWVTGFRAEASSPSAAGAAWHADLRLANGTRLLVAGSGLAPIAFPAGFGLPLGQILRDTPDAWRKAEVAGSAPAGVPMRVTVDFASTPAGQADDPLPFKRLYVLSLPLLDESAPEIDTPASADGNLLADSRATWPVPAGARQARKSKFSYLVPTDVTVHYVAAWLEGPARSVRITDLADGKVLWQAEAQGGAIQPYANANGFPLYREHEYEVEVVFDNAGAAPVPGTAALFLYYRPPGDEAFSYPYPPPGEGGGL